MQSRRHSGILLHPTSLPGPHGSGDLGAAAHHFVDWLVAGKQSLWQILPLGGSGPGYSPYMSPSAFAGNEQLIDLMQLRDAGWLTDSDVAPDISLKRYRINHAATSVFRMSRLRLAAERFFADARKDPRNRYVRFCADSSAWLDDYALFMALDAKLGGTGKVWQDWPDDLARRKPKARREASAHLAEEIGFWKFCQWCFAEQWEAIRRYAHERDIRIIGDMPIFVSAHSADVWSHQSLFDLDSGGWPRVVAGVPPDYFSATGQHWGNPLYDWPAHEREAYCWWIARVCRSLELCDVMRIDHFRGFESYWEIPASAKTAIEGIWKKGPGAALFDAINKGLHSVSGKAVEETGRFIAEDLGIITPEVTRLRKKVGLPGMRILQFAFDGHTDNPYLPHNFESNTVVYTGTHDNDTTCGWWKALPGEEQDRVRKYLGSHCDAIHWDLIRAASASVAMWSIIPMQDVLGLDSMARMNTPGTGEGSWSWRFDWDQVNAGHAEQLAEFASIHGRVPRRRSDTPAEHRM